MSAPYSETSSESAPAGLTNMIAVKKTFEEKYRARVGWEAPDLKMKEPIDDLFRMAKIANTRRKLATILGGISPEDEYSIGRDVYALVTELHLAVANGFRILYADKKDSLPRVGDFKRVCDKYKESLEEKSARTTGESPGGKAAGAGGFSSSRDEEEVAKLHANCEVFLDIAQWRDDGDALMRRRAESGNMKEVDVVFALLMSKMPRLFLVMLSSDEELVGSFREMMRFKQVVLDEIGEFVERNNSSQKGASTAFVKAGEDFSRFELMQMSFIKKIFEKVGDESGYKSAVSLIEDKMLAADGENPAPEELMAFWAGNYTTDIFETNFKYLSGLFDSSGLVAGGGEAVFSYGDYVTLCQQMIARSKAVDADYASIVAGGLADDSREKTLFSASYKRFWDEVVSKISAQVAEGGLDKFWLDLCNKKLAEPSGVSAVDGIGSGEESTEAAMAVEGQKSSFFERSFRGELKRIALDISRAEGAKKEGKSKAAATPPRGSVIMFTAGLGLAVAMAESAAEKAKRIEELREGKARAREERRKGRMPKGASADFDLPVMAATESRSGLLNPSASHFSSRSTDPALPGQGREK